MSTPIVTCKGVESVGDSIYSMENEDSEELLGTLPSTQHMMARVRTMETSKATRADVDDSQETM